MFRISDLMDLPIKPLINEKRYKLSVKSILIDGSTNKAVALICKEGAIKKYSKIIPYDKVISVDEDGIIIPDKECIKKVHSKDLCGYIQIDDVMNKLIRSATGELYGRLTDVYVNLLNGKITAFELSEGYLDDFLKGRRIIDLKDALGKSITKEEIVFIQRLN